MGYRTEEEANAAVEFFNRTFIDTARISVELSKPKGDPTLSRPWSAYSEGSSKYNKKHGIRPTKQRPSSDEKKDNLVESLYEEVLAKHQDDPRFTEFLQVMAPRAKSKTWANDDLIELNKQEQKAVKKAIQTQRKDIEGPSKPEGNDDGEYQDLPNHKSKNPKQPPNKAKMR